MAQADVGVFGGSGFYRFLEDVETYTIETPYGPPSAPVAIGDIGGHRVAFLPRHGTRHELPPHRIAYRANAWAMHELGVRAIVAPCAAGSLQAHIHPGELVVVDQLVDRTWGRADTFFDGPDVQHVAFADPYNADLRATLVASAHDLGLAVHDGGTMVVVQGPRFSTRAESRWFSSMGWEVINMTGHPEAVLAAELRIPYAAVALITDYDAGLEGIDGIEPVTQEMVFSFFEGNIERVRALLFEAIPRLS
ncbi:MAG TPA: S-methyl-5'-thioadenosine phosphorylase [Acidimicrobiales bacterium]|nr:S-methyl-5'-thioadenosine phosphorylase [Acidimicrobiales bacterium]